MIAVVGVVVEENLVAGVEVVVEVFIELNLVADVVVVGVKFR